MKPDLKVKRKREGQLSYLEIEEMIFLSEMKGVTPEEVCAANEVDLLGFIESRERYKSGGRDRLNGVRSPREQSLEIKVKQQAAYIEALKREIDKLQTPAI